MKRGPDMDVDVPGRWEAETEARLIEYVKKVRVAADQNEAVKIVAEELRPSLNKEMRQTIDKDIASITEKIRSASTEETAVDWLRSRFAPLAVDRLYGELADMGEGKGKGKE